MTISKGERRRRQIATSCVYIVGAGEYVKIGFTRSSVAKRMRDIQTGNPIPLELLATFPHRHPHRLEAFLHAMLEERRAAGEWFTCSVPEVERLVTLTAHLVPSSTWADWQRVATENGGGRLAANWEERRAGSARATRRIRRTTKVEDA